MNSCKHCYEFKQRWKDGAGTCWFQSGADRQAGDPICDAFTPKVVVVKRDGEPGNDHGKDGNAPDLIPPIQPTPLTR